MRTFFAALSVSILVGSAHAAFFSNIADNKNSQEASALAFEAIARVFEGLAVLERESVEANPAAFDEALGSMTEAIDRFDALANSEIAVATFEAAGVTDE